MTEMTEMTERNHEIDMSLDSIDIDDTLDDTLDESDEEVIEPLFNYKRIDFLPRSFFRKDAVSAVFVCSQVLVFASHSGVVHLCDGQGAPIRSLRLHRASIVDISYSSGYVATASIDGTVVIVSVKDPQDVAQLNFKRPVHSVALEANYSSSKRFLSGGSAGTVLLSEPGWLKAWSEIKLFQTDSTILYIRWIGQRALWFSEEGMTLYDFSTSTVILRVPRLPNSPPADLYRPHLTILPNQANVLVVWASTIWELDIQAAEVSHTLSVDWVLSGITPCLLPDSDEFGYLALSSGKTPELRLIDTSGTEVYVDELGLQGHEQLGVNDYFLADTSEFEIYIVCASDGVIASKRTARDHIEWLVEQGEYYAAFTVSNGVCDQEMRREIAYKAAHRLVEAGKYDETAFLLSQVLDATLPGEYETWAQEFLLADQYIYLANILPPDASSEALSSIRTEILEWCIKNDIPELEDYLHLWQTDSYDCQLICAKLERQPSNRMRSTLAKLLVATNDPIGGIINYVCVDSPEAFEVAAHYHVWKDVPDITSVILSGSNNDEQVLRERLEVLADNCMQLAPETVKQKLTQKKLLYLYLGILISKDDLYERDFADDLVDLYANFDREKLMGFLIKTSTYNISKAVEICEDHGYTEELVYLLGRIGQLERALALMVEELGDMRAAVKFTSQHKDEDLWSTLIEYSVSRPDLVLELLRSSDVRPACVLAAVPSDLEIKGLRPALCEVLKDQSLSLSLNERALSIVKLEGKVHMSELQKLRQQGLEIEHDALDWSKTAITGPCPLKSIETDIESRTFSDKIRHLGRLLRIL